MTRARILPTFLLLACVAGCATARYETLSSGYVGCRPDEIVISDLQNEFWALSWTATCRGRIFYCSATGRGYTCAPAIPLPSGNR
jgi:hypothetical protein